VSAEESPLEAPLEVPPDEPLPEELPPDEVVVASGSMTPLSGAPLGGAAVSNPFMTSFGSAQ
jgi:hypothetical protein